MGNMTPVAVSWRGGAFVRCAAALFVSILLPACGGGGGGDGAGGGGNAGGAVPDTPAAVVFTATSGAFFGLWAAMDDGSALTRLDDPAVPLGGVGGVASFKVSPDRQNVAFVQPSLSNIAGLYVVGVSGGARTEVSGNASAAATISGYEWSPDGSRLAFVSDQETAGTMNVRNEVFVVDAVGMNRSKASKGIANLVDNPQWSFDSRYVAIEVAEAAAGGIDLAVYDTQTDTSVTAINNSAPGNAANREFQQVAWSPDNQRIAYLMDRDVDFKNELYISTIDGATTVKPYAGLIGSVASFAWDPVDGSKIAYLAEQDIAGVLELYTSAPDGTQNQKQHEDLMHANLDLMSFAFSPDGMHIAYTRDSVLAGVTDLYVNTAPDDGNPLTPPQSVAIFDTIGALGAYAWWPDSSALVYRANQVHGVPASLWTVGRLGFNNHRSGYPHPAPLNGPLTSTGPLFGAFTVSRFAPVVAYGANIDGDSFEELYINALSGGAEVLVNPRDPADPSLIEQIPWRAWSRVSTRIAYVAERTGERSLYASNAAGTKPIKLSDVLEVRTLPPLEPVY
jgi:Tol biopolymer transport system component